MQTAENITITGTSIRLIKLADKLNVDITTIYTAMTVLQIPGTKEANARIGATLAQQIALYITSPKPELVEAEPVANPLDRLISTSYDEGLVEHFNLKIDGLTINTLINEMNDSESNILKGFAAKLQTKVKELSRTNSPWL